MAKKTQARKKSAKTGARRATSGGADGLARKLGDRILKIVSEIPRSVQPRAKQPELASKELVSKAARDAAAISGLLALPPGPMAVLTILPDLYAVWTRQAQLVADVAAMHGRTGDLDRGMMLRCLFGHVYGHAAARDVVVRAGHRLALRRAARRAGACMCERVAASSLLRWLPIVGAAGLGAYAYYDTCQVGCNALEAFGSKSSS